MCRNNTTIEFSFNVLHISYILGHTWVIKKILIIQESIFEVNFDLENDLNIEIQGGTTFQTPSNKKHRLPFLVYSGANKHGKTV